MASIADTPERGARRRGAGAGSEATGRARTPLLLVIFMLTLVVPIVFEIGGIRLGPYRLLLLATVIPLLAQLAGGKAGRMRAPDGLVLFYGFWILASLLFHHGMERFPYAVMTAIEAIAPYLIGRILIRDAESFAGFARLLLMILLALLPFAAYEALTGSRLISDFFRMGFATYGIAHQELRWGMTRAQTSFEHPILYGVFASTGFMLAYYVLGALKGGASGRFWTVVAGGATFFSLSMGAFLSGMAQAGLWAYDHLTRGMKDRWKLLIIASVSAYVFVDLASNRGPVQIFIQNLVFNSLAAWQRLVVWEYGTDVVWRNPLFGIGLASDWPRPHWVTASVDNFWLLNAMRYGLPAVVPLIAAFYLVVVRTARRRFDDPLGLACQKGYLIVMVGLAFALCTVHAWNALFCYVMFLLGAGMWMTEEASAQTAPASRGAGRPAGRDRSRTAGAGGETGRGSAAPAPRAPPERDAAPAREGPVRPRKPVRGD